MEYKEFAKQIKAYNRRLFLIFALVFAVNLLAASLLKYSTGYMVIYLLLFSTFFTNLIRTVMLRLGIELKITFYLYMGCIISYFFGGVWLNATTPFSGVIAFSIFLAIGVFIIVVISKDNDRMISPVIKIASMPAQRLIIFAMQTRPDIEGHRQAYAEYYDDDIKSLG